MKNVKIRDSQRSKLYRWEREDLRTAWQVLPEDNTPLGERRAQELVNSIWESEERCAGLGRPPKVRVMGNRGRGSAWYDIIKLSSTYLTTQTRWYVIHELAHVIHLREGAVVASHGPEFCELYAQLLDRHTTANYWHVVASMREARLKVSSFATAAGDRKPKG